ncbi:hypothetical protein [Sulfitobacter sp. 1A12157]|uniref:hypothetical protein n=1 Tax=Sulfitobacter sp. 1A12157 TaxID=3368594 RepID=UPI0037455C5F
MRVREWFKTRAEREQDETRDNLKAVRKAMQEEMIALQNALSHSIEKGQSNAAD